MSDFEAVQKDVLDRIVSQIPNSAFVLRDEIWCINQKHPQAIAAAGIGIAIRLAFEERGEWTASAIVSWLNEPSPDLRGKTPLAYCEDMRADLLGDFRRAIANSAL